MSMPQEMGSLVSLQRNCLPRKKQPCLLLPRSWQGCGWAVVPLLPLNEVELGSMKSNSIVADFYSIGTGRKDGQGCGPRGVGIFH